MKDNEDYATVNLFDASGKLIPGVTSDVFISSTRQHAMPAWTRPLSPSLQIKHVASASPECKITIVRDQPKRPW